MGGAGGGLAVGHTPWGLVPWVGGADVHFGIPSLGLRGLTLFPPPPDEPCLHLRRNVFFPKHKELEVGGGTTWGPPAGPPPPW